MASNKFKYQKEIQSLELNIDCPPKTCLEKDIDAYRFAFETIQNPATFLPQILKPGRVKRINNKSEKHSRICEEFGLSFYTSRVQALERYNGFPEPAKTNLGYTHLAKGQINTTDGVITNIQQNGHFDLHEYENVDLTTKFIIVDKL